MGAEVIIFIVVACVAAGTGITALVVSAFNRFKQWKEKTFGSKEKNHVEVENYEEKTKGADGTMKHIKKQVIKIDADEFMNFATNEGTEKHGDEGTTRAGIKGAMSVLGGVLQGPSLAQLAVEQGGKLANHGVDLANHIDARHTAPHRSRKGKEEVDTSEEDIMDTGAGVGSIILEPIEIEIDPTPLKKHHRKKKQHHKKQHHNKKHNKKEAKEEDVTEDSNSKTVKKTVSARKSEDGKHVIITVEESYEEKTSEDNESGGDIAAAFAGGIHTTIGLDEEEKTSEDDESGGDIAAAFAGGIHTTIGLDEIDSSGKLKALGDDEDSQ